MSITFELLDTVCEQADQSFFIPQVIIKSKSTTQFATLYGYGEFGKPSTPPKKYRKATLSGVSERIGFTAEKIPRMCAGAKYEWSGFGEYNLKGVQTASYSKKFFAQCSKQYWPSVPLQINPFAISPCTNITFCKFVGYCWPPDQNSCPTCSANIVDWPLIGDQTTNVLQLDLAAFRIHPNVPVVTNTSWSVSDQFFGLTAIASPPYTFQFDPVSSGYTVQVGSLTLNANTPFTEPILAFPIEVIEGVAAAYINWVDASNYSAVLSEEYTDADALANATIVTGTSSTAATTPRTTGFTSTFTSVVFTIMASNLISGKDYLVTVDMWEKGPGVNTHTPKQYGFTAAGATHTITDVVATPAANHTITVQKPTIDFAPL